MSKTNKRLVGILLALAMVLSMLPMAVLAADTTTLYCAAPSGWGNCNVYWWGSSQPNPGWPGEAMTKGADGLWYYDVPSDATNVIFNNGSGSQTVDLIMPTDENVQFNYAGGSWGPYDNEVEIPETKTVTVYVEAPASWGTPNAYFWGSASDAPGWPGYAMTAVEGNVYSYNVPADATGLIFNGTGGQTADLTLPTGEDVMYSVATASWGPFEIKAPVEVTYTYVVAGSETLCGTAWDTTNTDNEMTVDGNTASITYTAVAAGDYEFKVVKVGSDASTQWFGTGVEGQDNVSFTVSTACDVVITFNIVDGAVAVTGNGLGSEEPPIPVEFEYYLAGDEGLVGVNWDPAANKMTEVSEGIFEITFYGVAAGTYEYKVTTGSWETPSFGYNGGNFSVTLYADCDITITFVEETGEALVEATNDALVPPPVVYDYYVAGSEGLCGVEWDPASNQMYLDGSTGLYTKNFIAMEGSYEYKITTGSWETPSYGPAEGGNYTVLVKDYSYVTITFDPETTEVTCEVRAMAADFLKFQLNTGASADDETVDLRMITYVESLDYSTVKFFITIEGETAEVECQTVYTAINANGSSLSCSDIFNVDGYLVTYTMANTPAEWFGAEIKVEAVFYPNENNTELSAPVSTGMRTVVLSEVLA